MTARLGAGNQVKGKPVKSLFVACAAVATATILPTSASASGITYDCDTAANHFSELVLPAPAGPFTVTGTVQINALAAVTQYVPLARIQITSPSAPGAPATTSAEVLIEALPADAKKNPTGASAVQFVGFRVDAQKEDLEPLSALEKAGTPEPFSLHFDGSQVAATIGKGSRTLPLKASAPVVRIVCSTGEFLITNLTISPSP